MHRRAVIVFDSSSGFLLPVAARFLRRMAFDVANGARLEASPEFPGLVIDLRRIWEV